MVILGALDMFLDQVGVTRWRPLVKRGHVALILRILLTARPAATGWIRSDQDVAVDRMR